MNRVGSEWDAAHDMTIPEEDMTGETDALWFNVLEAGMVKTWVESHPWELVQG